MTEALIYVPYIVGEHDYGSQYEAMYTKLQDKFFSWDNEVEDYCIELKPSHWMPLPEPPDSSDE